MLHVEEAQDTEKAVRDPCDATGHHAERARRLADAEAIAEAEAEAAGDEGSDDQAEGRAPQRDPEAGPSCEERDPGPLLVTAQAIAQPLRPVVVARRNALDAG